MNMLLPLYFHQIPHRSLHDVTIRYILQRKDISFVRAIIVNENDWVLLLLLSLNYLFLSFLECRSSCSIVSEDNSGEDVLENNYTYIVSIETYDDDCTVQVQALWRVHRLRGLCS